MGGDEFLETNVIGTKRLLDQARAGGLRYLQVSTDEVYGDVEAPHRSLEGDALAGSSPYAASKAAGDLLVLSYARTFGLDALDHARLQHLRAVPVPREAHPALRHQPAGRHPGARLRRRPAGAGDALRRRPRRRDRPGAARAAPRARRTTSAPSTRCRTSRRRARLLALTGRDDDLITYVADRPGHDRRYAHRLRQAARASGWQRSVSFDEGLARTVDWFRDHRAWWEPIKSGEAYAAYHAKNYDRR